METNNSWNDYNKANRRDEKMAYEWIVRLRDWFDSDVFRNRKMSILDYGCGYFDLGLELLKSGHMVDGFDPYDAGLELARKRIQATNKSAQIFGSVQDIPKNRYEVIVLNSVLQYMTQENEVERFFLLCRQLFREGRGIVVISDVIPRDYSPLLDGLACLFYAARKGLLIPMGVHLYRTIQKKGHKNIKRYDFSELKALAEAAGFHIKKLEHNLTPSSRRYSVALEIRKI